MIIISQNEVGNSLISSQLNVSDSSSSSVISDGFEMLLSMQIKINVASTEITHTIDDDERANPSDVLLATEGIV